MAGNGGSPDLRRRPVVTPPGHGQRHPVPHRGGRRGAAGSAAARVPAVLVDLAGTAHLAAGRRLPGGRRGPARVRRQRQASPRLRPDHRGVRRGRAWSGRWARPTPSSSATTGAGWSPGPWPPTSRRWSGASPSFPWPTRCGCGPPCSSDAVRQAGQRADVRLPAAAAAGTAAGPARGQAGRPDAARAGPGRDGRTRRWSAATAPPCACPRSRTRRWSITAGSSGPGCGPDGMRYAHRMRAPVQAPTLQLHGALDSCVLPSAPRVAAAATSTRRTGGG